MRFDGLKDSGKREDMETGSRRDTQEGKSRPDLMNPLVLRRLGMHFANGCDKYGEKNFELGQKTSRYRASLGRHLLDYDEGLKDEDHVAAIIWNAMCIMMNQEFVERGIYDTNLDDFTDYRDKVGFDSTVGARANAHNDALRRKGTMNAAGQMLLPEDTCDADGNANPPIPEDKCVADVNDNPPDELWTGFCMGTYDPDTCGDCFSQVNCIRMGITEIFNQAGVLVPIVKAMETWNEEIEEDLEDVPEVPPCFGVCLAVTEDVSFKSCDSCNEEDICETHSCHECDFIEECNAEVKLETEIIDLVDEVPNPYYLPMPGPLGYSESVLGHFVAQADTPEHIHHGCYGCNHHKGNTYWSDWPCNSCTRNKMVDKTKVCSMDMMGLDLE